MEHRVILVGLGFFGKEWLRAIQRNPDAKLAGIVARTEKTLDAISSEFGVDRSIGATDYCEAFKRFDAEVALCVVHPWLHREVIVAALEAGMHVITEKPLEVSMEAAKEILACSTAHPKQHVMVSQNYRWRPHAQTLKSAIDRGAVGKIAHVSMRMYQFEPVGGYFNEFPYPTLQDVAVHQFDLMRWLTGKECVRIYARSYAPPWSRWKGFPTSEAVLDFEDGIGADYFGTVMGSGALTTWDGDMTILGEKGMLTVDASCEVHMAGSPGGKPEKLAPVRTERLELDYAWDQMTGAIETGRKPECSLDDNVKTFAMVAAGVESCRRGAPVEVASMLASPHR
ncbi:MAG: Gfo/Idh/MocA family oxidoreductase [Planctomycetota bacterium]